MGVLEYAQLEEVIEKVLKGALREGLSILHKEVDLQEREKRMPE